MENSTEMKFNIQGNKKEKFLNFVMLCATSGSVGEEARALGSMPGAPHREGATWQSRFWKRRGTRSHLAGSSFTWCCPGIAAIPSGREKCVDFVSGIQSVCSKTEPCTNHQKIHQDLFRYVRLMLEIAFMVIDWFLFLWWSKHQETLR